MRRTPMGTMVVALGALMLVSSVAFAETSPAAPATATPAAPAAKPGKTMRVTAEVVSVDAQAGNVVVKQTGKTPKELTLAVDKGVKTADLKPGERVRVSYVDMGGHLMAKAITPLQHAAAKK